MREVLVERELHDSLLWLAQPGEFVGDQHAIGDGVGGGGLTLVGRVGRGHGPGGPSLPLPERPSVGDLVAGDAEQVSRESPRVGGITLAPLPRCDEDLLRHVVGILGVPQSPQRHPVNQRSPAHVRLAQGGLVAGAEADRDVDVAHRLHPQDDRGARRYRATWARAA